MNKEYIDKHEAYLLLKNKAETYMLPATKEAYEKAAILIASMETYEVQPVKSAHWYINPDGYYPPVKHGRWERRMAKIYACSECTNEVTDRQRQNYSFCPYCGALMDVVYKDDKIRAIKVVGWDGDSE